MSEEKSIDKSIPHSTEELYDLLIHNSDMAGKIEFVDDGIFWNFKDFWIYAFLDCNEGYISVNRKKKHWWESEQLLHWHPMKDEIYKDLSDIGNKNNVLVIRNGYLFADIFYLGNVSGYKYLPSKKWHWGKLYYLKPQD